jgi:hypothetical protein
MFSCDERNRAIVRKMRSQLGEDRQVGMEPDTPYSA